MIFLRVLFFVLPALPLSGAWLNDLGKARELATEEQKDIFLVFTSLKFSGACVQLEKRVLSRPSFQKALGEHFVLVHLDVPLQQTPGMVSPQAKNRTAAEQFGVESYPAFFWLDSQGRAYAGGAGTMAGTAAEVAERVLRKHREERKRRDTLRLCYQKEGMARARALVAILADEVRGADPVRDADHLEELARLDPDDTLGFRQKRQAELAFEELEGSLEKAFREGAHAEAVKQVQAYLKDHQPPSALMQKVLFRKLAALRHLGRREEARTTARRVVALDPESAHGRFASRILDELLPE